MQHISIKPLRFRVGLQGVDEILKYNQRLAGSTWI